MTKSQRYQESAIEQVIHNGIDFSLPVCTVDENYTYARIDVTIEVLASAALREEIDKRQAMHNAPPVGSGKIELVLSNEVPLVKANDSVLFLTNEEEKALIEAYEQTAGVEYKQMVRACAADYFKEEMQTAPILHLSEAHIDYGERVSLVYPTQEDTIRALERVHFNASAYGHDSLEQLLQSYDFGYLDDYCFRLYNETDLYLVLYDGAGNDILVEIPLLETEKNVLSMLNYAYKENMPTWRNDVIDRAEKWVNHCVSEPTYNAPRTDIAQIASGIPSPVEVLASCRLQEIRAEQERTQSHTKQSPETKKKKQAELEL